MGNNGYQTWTRAAKHKQVRGAMTDGGGRSHKRHGSMKARLARPGPDCPGTLWKASEILCFVGQMRRLPRRISAGGCRSSRIMRITSASYVLGRHYLRVRCLYARICRRWIYARGTRRPISSALGRKRETFQRAAVLLLVPWRYLRLRLPPRRHTSYSTSCMAACGGTSYRCFLSSYKELVLGLFSRPSSHPLAGLSRLCACLVLLTPLFTALLLLLCCDLEL
jgi:hypothetical protein